ncbi:MAG: hypothetical protein KF723_07795 [Rhizobiaceae bacterium]|nr:hypothetical protein [Rhizobiaceae bacterium]
MAEVTNDLVFELIEKMQADLSLVNDGLGEVRQDLVSIRLTQLGTQNDVHNICGILAGHDDRIERRLQLRELAERPRPLYTPA